MKLTILQASQKHGIPRQTIYDYISSGRLKAQTMGYSKFIDEKKLLELRKKLLTKA